MKRCIPVVLLSLLVVFAAQAGATNLIQNGDFTSGFDHWTLGTTSNGTAGQGFPAVTGCMFHIGYLCWTGQVGQVNSSDQFEGATLSQTFLSAAGSATISMWYESFNAFQEHGTEGGLFQMYLDGSLVAQQDTGYLQYLGGSSGTLTGTVSLTAGQHTLQIDVLNDLVSDPNHSAYQWVGNVDVEGQVPEPGSLILVGSSVLGLAGVLRRKTGL